MKRLFLAAMFLPFMAYAENLSLSFKAIPVMDFAEATYKSILNKDYVISPDLIGLDKRVTINIKQIDRTKLPQLLGDVLASVGVSAREVSGIVRLERDSNLEQPTPASPSFRPSAGGVATPDSGNMAREDVDDFEIYRPKNRTVEYLQSVLRSAGLSIGSPSGSQGNQVAQQSIVVMGGEKRRAKIMKLLSQLDQPQIAMNVRAALVEFTDAKDDTFSLGALLDVLGGKLNLALNAGMVPTDNFARLKTGGIDAVLKAINGDSRFRFRTQPSIRLVDGERGRLMVGSEVPVRGALTLSKDGTPVQSVDYRSSGLVLTVQPRALDGRFTANVVQEVSSFASTSTSNIDSPTLNKRSIEAVVEAEDGEVVVLAGLDEESSTSTRSGLSWLPFPTSNTSTERKTQLLVLLEFQRL